MDHEYERQLPDHDNISQGHNKELFANGSSNNEWMNSDHCNVSQVVCGQTTKNKQETHDVAAITYMLSMLLISNVLTCTLKVFYR
jgi:hypothetical protein